MKRVLKFEFYKLIRQKSLYIILAILLFFSGFTIVISKLLLKFLEKMSEEDAKLVAQVLIPSSKGAMLNAFSNSNFSVLCGVFVTLFVCADYGRNQTVKNVYARGVSPRQTFWAKAIVVFVVTSVMFVVLVAFSFGVGSLVFGKTKGANGRYFACMFGQYLLALAYAYLAFFYSISFKKTVIALVFVIVVTSLFDSITVAVSMLISKWIGFNPAKYWLSNFLAEFINIGITGKTIATRYALTVAYTALFLTGGYFINKKHKC